MKIGNPADKPAQTPATHGVPNSHASANGIAHARGTRATAAPVAAEPPATPPVATTPPLAEPSATLELSNTAATLLTSGSTAEFDAEKVARISKAIEDGTFQINPDAIAAKLIANAQEVLTKSQA